MDRKDLLVRMGQLEDALAMAIEALTEYVGNDESSTLDYLERVLDGTSLDDAGE